MHRPDGVACGRRLPAAHGLIEVLPQLVLAQKVFCVVKKSGFAAVIGVVRVPCQSVNVKALIQPLRSSEGLGGGRDGGGGGEDDEHVDGSVRCTARMHFRSLSAAPSRDKSSLKLARCKIYRSILVLSS